MSIVLFTPTIRPGIDVSVESVRRQTVQPNEWLISDHLWSDRLKAGIYDHIVDDLDLDVQAFDPRPLTTRPYTIQAGYNSALRYCRARGDVELLVCMEDYIWIPSDGIHRMRRMASLFPDSLLGAIISGSADPDASSVTNPTGLYTIFDEPYTGEPVFQDWEDCRLDRGRRGFSAVESQRWEPPFAAIPKAILDDDRLWFNEEYDQGMTHGNQWFSALCNANGHPTMLDLENRGWALPHHAYWPHERAAHLAEGNNHDLHERNKVRMGWR